MLAKDVWRDFSVDGDHTSDIHQPAKADIRKFLRGHIAVGPSGDATAELQSSIDYVKNNNTINRHSLLGDIVYDPSALDFSTGNTKSITWDVNGRLLPDTTIPIDRYLDVHGIGGAAAGAVQFQIGACCEIADTAGNVSVVEFTDAVGQTLENVTIPSCYIGVKFDGVNQLGALANLKNVNVLCDVEDGSAFLADAFFWIWAENCKFLAHSGFPGSKSMRITNTNDSNSSAGLHFFSNCITAGFGVSVEPTDGICSNIHFDNHHHEGLPSGDHFFYAAPGCHTISFDRLGESDPHVGAGKTFSVAGVRNFVVTNPCTLVTFDAYPDTGWINNDYYFDQTGLIRDIASTQVNIHGTDNRGAVSARLLARGHMNTMPVAIGTPVAVTIPSTGVAGGISWTNGEIGPDGTATATKVISNTPGAGAGVQSHNIYSNNTALLAGDIVEIYTMVKMLDTTSGGNSQTGIFNIVWLDGDVERLTGPGRSAFEARPAGPDHSLKDDGWMPLYSAFRVVTGATHALILSIIVADNSAGFRIWDKGTAIRIIPATSGVTRADAVRHSQGFGGMHTAKQGVAACMDHQCTRTGLAATGSRPAAADVGVGAQFFDTTLGKPIWSNGTVWKDAAGTTV